MGGHCALNVGVMTLNNIRKARISIDQSGLTVEGCRLVQAMPMDYMLNRYPAALISVIRSSFSDTRVSSSRYECSGRERLMATWLKTRFALPFPT